MGLRQANSPILDKAGYVTAVVVRTGFGKGIVHEKKGKDDFDVREYEQYEIEFAVDGTVSPIKMNINSGTTLNKSLPVDVGPGKRKPAKPVYNRLTTIALALGFVQPEELESITPDLISRVEQSLLSLEGAKVQFRLGKVEGRTLTYPVPDSLRIVE